MTYDAFIFSRIDVKLSTMGCESMSFCLEKAGAKEVLAAIFS